MFIYFILLYGINISAGISSCQKKTFGDDDGIVCVCNEGHCDFTEEFAAPFAGKYTLVISSKDGRRFDVEEGVESAVNAADYEEVWIDYTRMKQTILGFGGSFTDAAGLNIKSLPKSLQESLMKSYFSPTGNAYNLGRIPIGGSDFSTRPYSYDDVEDDVELKHFSLAMEDFNYKIPLIKEAKGLAPFPVLLLGSPWSPPAWMKDNGQFNGTGSLKKEFYDVYARYILKFLKAYDEEGVAIWGITPQNEPKAGLKGGLEDWPFNSCGWRPEDLLQWLRDHLVPKMKRQNLEQKLVIVDGSRFILKQYANTILSDKFVADAVYGIGIHPYTNDKMGPEILDEIRETHPGKVLLFTEICAGYDAPHGEKVVLGSWENAEYYGHDIIENMNHGVSGWIDWNLALDMDGGPNWANNPVDSPIIINKEEKEFYKQPMYYAIGHFSKFVKRGSVSLNSGSKSEKLHVTTFRNPENVIIVVLLNKAEENKKIQIKTERNTSLLIQIPKRSIASVIFKGNERTTEEL